MKKFFLLLLFFFYSAIAVYADYLPIPNYQINQYKVEIEYIINIEYPFTKKEIKNIIFISQSFRNVLIEVYYDLQSTEISKTESKGISGLIRAIKISCGENGQTLLGLGSSRVVMIIVNRFLRRCPWETHRELT